MKLRCSNKEHGFEPLLEKIPAAKRVTILSYSLDENPKSYLWETLHKLPAASDLTVITNIPGRWDSYGRNQTSKMKDRFDAYLDNLAAEKFECAFEVYFSFNNHAKVLVVDDMAYVGSANFTEASAQKWEAGVILSDKSEVDELQAFINSIRASSIPMLKAATSKEARPLLKLLRWSFEIIRSVREENGFILSDDQHWIDDPERSQRESVQISDGLRAFLSECRTAAEALLKRCDGDQEVLNVDILLDVIGFVRYFDEQDYNDSLAKPFDESAQSSHLVEKLLIECSNDANVDDVMRHPEYHEQLEAARSASEKELDGAVVKAVDDLVKYIEKTISKLRSSFGPEDVSPEIDNTGSKNR